MPELAGLHHVSLSVTDLAASVEWYTAVLGLELAFREEQVARRAAVLRFPGGPLVVGLVQHEGEGAGFDATVTGLDHAAFTVATSAELDVWAVRLDELGVDHSGAIDVPPGRILNLKDPDGIALALFWDRPAEGQP